VRVTPAQRGQQQLADALGVHRNDMVSLRNELEAAGWSCVADRRTFHLRLTRAGRNLVRQANDLIPPLDAELGTALSQAQRHQLFAQLKLIAQPLGLDPSAHPHLSAGAGGGS
jgi:DNA-binding MarR family transcriptional regulator